MRPFLFILLAIGMVFVSCKKEHPGLPDVVDFNYHIRPILSQNCFLCHGPDSSSREANLRLDIYDGATAITEEGLRAIFPRNPGKSEIIRRVTHADPEERMPPAEMNKVLSEREVALLEKWIKQGAKWKKWWAFVPPEVPRKVKRQDHPIDYLVDQKLDEKGIVPSESADKSSLARRLSYVLTGLPPKPEEVETFMADDSPEAYEKMVDHYLNVPAFGERWARHWMDLVRYGETRGHEFDFPISSAWRYRDYLIRAFNEDVPYDRFLKEHLAGDQLSPRLWAEQGTDESPLGTMFYNLGEGKHSPVDIKLEEYDRIDNMIDVTAKTFQALTVNCAKCHDHKFDPIPTTDYYAMYGILESARFTPFAAQTTRQTLDNLQEIKDLQKEMRAEIKKSLGEAPMVAMKANNPVKEETVVLSEDIDLLGDFRQGSWGDWLSDGLAFGEKPMVGEAEWKDGKLVGFSQGKASSKYFGQGIQGTLRSPNFIIEKDFLTARFAGKKASFRIIVDNFQIVQNPLYGLFYERLRDERPMQNYTVDVSPWKGHKAYIEFFPGTYFPSWGGHLESHWFQVEEDAWIEVEYAFIHNEEEENELPIIETDPASHALAMENWLKGTTSYPDVLALNDQLTQGEPIQEEVTQHIQKRIDTLLHQSFDSTHFIGMTQGEKVYSHVFLRGNHNKLSQDSVPHRMFAVLGGEDFPFSKNKDSRLQLAESMVDPSNPLTARVMVNRIWHHLFGRGIVETVDNFGIQGKFPSHPELLDYLALRFQEQGWSMKAIMKEILMSEAFQRSTAYTAEADSLDPENILLAHYPVRRLEAEAIRDGILAVSGCLDEDLYGPSVMIYFDDFMNGRGKPHYSGPIDGDGRRSIYLSIRRNFLIPFMTAFDQPVPFTSFGKRNVSNVPAQSLTLMNDPFVQLQAQMWAERLSAEEGNMEDQIKGVYMKAFARPPSPEELNNGKQFLEQRLAQLPLEDEDREVKAWKDYCHALINLKEFIYLM